MKNSVRKAPDIIVKNGKAKPFLKWVGGKGRLIPTLLDFFPEDYQSDGNGKFFEPFVGGGAMFFSLQPKIAHINDLNKVLIQAYIDIRDNVEKLIEKLDDLQAFYLSLPDLEQKKMLFLEKRAVFNDLPAGDFEKTVLLIFLNKTCFNGMYRENSKGGFNVPFGKHEKPNISDSANLRNVSNALKNTSISCTSYENAISEARDGDFVYFDPPYHPLNETSSFTSYQAGGFSAKDQEALRDVCLALTQRGCKVMISNSDASLINELYKKPPFKIHKIYAARAINSIGHKRGKILEVVITNY